jgi:hypothetical protein
MRLRIWLQAGRPDMTAMPNTSSFVRSQREVYQQTVIMLLGVRRSKTGVSTMVFLGGHAAMVQQLRDRWAALDDREGLPSPDQVLSWL